MTRFGSLDVRGLSGQGREYAELVPHTVELRIDEDLAIRALDLETLIATEQETDGESDRAALPILRRVLEEKTKGERLPAVTLPPGTSRTTAHDPLLGPRFW